MGLTLARVARERKAGDGRREGQTKKGSKMRGWVFDRRPCSSDDAGLSAYFPCIKYRDVVLLIQAFHNLPLHHHRATITVRNK